MTDSTLHDRAKELFLDALEFDGSERVAMIEARTGGDTPLRERVEGLLTAHGEVVEVESSGGTFLGNIASLPSAIELLGDIEEDLRPGQEIGPFRLEREIGRGGFGRVWLADQLEPVRRQVALKMLKAGLDTREITTRFLAERQALALMDHANIARIFDGGATERGLPWFAMEFVDGEPITSYCERRELPLAARITLFIDTCRAVQHAHQKGVVHRDIKPNNVLVAEFDGVPTPKVIDFGIAKAIEQSLTSETIQTLGGQVMGTPASMSPEQINHAADVDTRTDIYSLGALLYEMIAGVQPFADSQGELPKLDELLEAVRSDDPPRPSARLRDATEAGVVRSRDVLVFDPSPSATKQTSKTPTAKPRASTRS